MSVLCNVAGERLLRTTGLVASSSDYTAMAWVNIPSLPSVAAYKVPFTRTNAAQTAYTGIYTDLDGGSGFGLVINNGGGLNLVDGDGYNIGVWFHVAYIKSGNTHSLYVNGTLKGSVSVDISAVTISQLFAGGDGLAGCESNISVAYFREWDDNLSQAEVTDEMNSTVPLEDLADLVTDTPLASDLLDDSGNGNDWTAVGSTSFTDQPTFLANSTFATATAIGTTLPFTASLNLNPGSVVAFDAWYSYVGQTGDTVIGIWGFGNLTDFSPTVTVWSPDGVTSYLNMSAANVPIQIPVTLATTYYIRFRPNTRTLSTATLSVSVLRAPSQTVPIGSIAVNDDTDGFPLAVMSSVDGDDDNVLRFFTPFPAGEAGDILNDGSICVQDLGAGTIKFFDASYTQTADVAFAGDIIRTCRDAQKFYVGIEQGAPTPVRVYDNDGTLLDTHSLTSIAQRAAIAASNDETILYHIQEGNNRALGRWDLVNDVALSDLTAAVASYQTQDILVQSDDTILATYINQSTGDVQVRRFNAAGTLLNTYNFGTDHLFPTGTNPRLAYSLLDPASFWLWTHPASTPGRSVFREIATSNGATLRTVTYQEYELGDFNSAATATPERFGNSFSCPFWVATTAFPSGGGSDGSLIVEKVTSPTTDTTAFAYTSTGGLTPSTFALVHGESTAYTGLTPGTFGVTETLNPMFVTSYEVSNGDPHDAIAIGAGDVVTVTVTNTRVDEIPGAGTLTEFPIRRLRRSPHTTLEQLRIAIHRVQIDLQPGIGTETGIGEDPDVMFRFSIDGGRTWSNERKMSAGALGHYLARAQTYRLGQGRDWVFEVVVSDPNVPWVLLDLIYDPSPGLN